MPNVTRNFLKGRMNKSVDERLLPDGEYIDALNIRMSSTEGSEIGVIENSKGNTSLVNLVNIIDPINPLLTNAKCIGAYADSANETIYWFVHATNVTGPTDGILDMIVSYNADTQVVRYHVVTNSTLNFNPSYLINGVDLIEDLLFFTDNFNEPRFININRDYEFTSASYVDPSDLAEQLLVIKRPPTEAPTVNLIESGDGVNFIEDRVISFAYRYRYADGEYSATSPFSEPAFLPSSFSFDIDSFLNEGMVNSFNSAEITYNTGGSLVQGIDILFKDNSDSVIKVIQKVDKSQNNLSDNSDEVFRFDKSKVFTILPESEILRLYDNVPIKALAQTIMGNRLMYGNYFEGYNLEDSNGEAVRLDYSTSLVASEVQSATINGTTSIGSYNVATSPRARNDSVISFDLGTSNIENPQEKLVPGARLEFSLIIAHDSFDALSTVTPINVTDTQELTFSYTLLKSYNSFSELYSDPTFIAAIGTVSNIQSNLSLSCDGTTMTDFFNCQLPDSLLYGTLPYSTLEKNASGIDGTVEPIKLTSDFDVMSLQIVAAFFEDTATPTNECWEYFKFVSGQVTFIGANGGKSLHSNRDYSLAMVYLDDYGRASTGLTSIDNVVHVPCANSSLSNQIKVVIPTTQKPPTWATKYKFVARANQDTYETIYSNIYFLDTDENYGYILLEGENAAKVEVGDELVLKADASGPITSCENITILEKEAKEAGFVTSAPAGLYIKVRNNNIDLRDNTSERIVKIDQGNKSGRNSLGAYSNTSVQDGGGDIAIGIGARVKINIVVERHGVGGCDGKKYVFQEEFTSALSYSSFYDWFVGENIDVRVVDGIKSGGNFNVSYLAKGAFSAAGRIGPSQINFCFDSGETEFRIQTFENCGNNTVYCRARFEIISASDTIVFETKPVDTNPDVYFENDITFDIVNGFHTSNGFRSDSQDQTALIPAIVYPRFYNCFAFGNGVESYKIKDSISGARFDLGNRATSVASEDYRQAHRFADITYSGIYNDESNVNKLNEFNLGLFNFKNLEEIYGSVTVLDGRKTDVLVLQEDKISYVLAGKNLLSDATEGGAITSVPQVLGTQIARVEDYGNSFNPESYVQWGMYKYFTDAKRGVVIELTGSSAQNETLTVVSSFGMREYFRDLFIDDVNSQKIGAFDPYMNEYVLGANDTPIPREEDCVPCSTQQSNITVSSASPVYTFCVELDNRLGSATIFWDTGSSPSGNVTINVDSGSDTANDSIVSGGASAGSFALTKNDPSTKTATITITHTSGDAVNLKSFIVGCVEGNELTVIEVVLTDNADSGDTVHTEYSYTSGGYTTPRVSTLITFNPGPYANDSLYRSTTGFQGQPNIPVDLSTVTLFSVKKSGDTYDFTSLNSFKYLLSNTLYTSSNSDLKALLADGSLQTLVSSGIGPEFNGSFMMPNPTSSDYLYLIWDLRNVTEIELCLDPSTVADACCDCLCASTACSGYTVTVNSGTVLVSYVECDSGEQITQAITATGNICVAAGADAPTIVSGDGSIAFDETDCDCGSVGASVTAFGSYFIDGADFSRATIIANNNTLTSFPPLGWYSDGVIARFSDGNGSLSPASECPNCP